MKTILRFSGFSLICNEYSLSSPIECWLRTSFEFGKSPPLEVVTAEIVEVATTDPLNVMDNVNDNKTQTIKLHRGHVMGELHQYFYLTRY
jgi:hypothetical protein